MLATIEFIGSDHKSAILRFDTWKISVVVPSVVSESKAHLIAPQKKIPAKTDVMSRDPDLRLRLGVESRCSKAETEVGGGGD